MTEYVDVKFDLKKEPTEWTLRLIFGKEVNSLEGIMIMFLSMIRVADEQGIDRDALIDALVDNMENQEDFQEVSLKRQLPKGDA